MDNQPQKIVLANENVQVAFWWQDYPEALSTKLHSVQESKARAAFTDLQNLAMNIKYIYIHGAGRKHTAVDGD